VVATRAWWEAFLISEVETRENNPTENLENNTERHPQEGLFIVDDYILFIQINIQSVFWIRDILVRIRTTDLRIRILLFSSVTFKMPTKISFLLSTYF
jgi:hypothetical protein